MTRTRTVALSMALALVTPACLVGDSPPITLNDDLPSHPDNQARKFMAQADGVLASIRDKCMVGAVAPFIKVAGTAVTAMTSLVTGAFCLNEIDKSIATLKVAWYALNDTAGKSQTLRYLAADGLIGVFIYMFPDLLRDPIPLAVGGPTLKDHAQDLERKYLLCLREPDPNTSAACAALIGNATPPASPLRERLSKSWTHSQCIKERLGIEADLQMAFAACAIEVNLQQTDGTLPLLTVSQKDIAIPQEPSYDRFRALYGDPMPTMQSIVGVLNRLGIQDRSVVWMTGGQASPLGYGTLHTLEHDGVVAQVALYGVSNGPSTGKPFGGYIRVNGIRFDFVFQYAANGDVQYDAEGNFVFMLRGNDGNLYRGVSTGGGQLKSLQKVRYSARDVLWGLHIEKLADGSPALMMNGRAINLDASRNYFTLDGVFGRLERDGSGAITGITLVTPRGAETYPVDGGGNLTAVVSANGKSTIRGTVYTTDGQRYAVEIESQPDGGSVREEKAANGSVVRRVATASNGSTTETIGEMMIIRNADGHTLSVTQFDFQTGNHVVCAAYGTDNKPRYCSDGNRSWNPEDGWNGEGPSAEQQFWCLGSVTCYTHDTCFGTSMPCTVDAAQFVLGSPPFQPPVELDCWNGYVVGQSYETVVAHAPEVCRRYPLQETGFIEVGKTTRMWGILLIDQPTAIAPADNDGCTEIVGDRALEIYRFGGGGPNSRGDYVGRACLDQLDPFRIDFHIPASVAPGRYNFVLRNTGTGAELNESAGRSVLATPASVVVDPVTNMSVLSPGGYGVVYGPTGATTEAAASPAECATTLAGRSLTLGGQVDGVPGPVPMCLTYVGPYQVNFVVPLELAAHAYTAWVYDPVTQLYDWYVTGHHTARFSVID